MLTEGKFLKCSSLGLGVEEEDTDSFDGNPTYVDCEVFPRDSFKCDGVHVSVIRLVPKSRVGRVPYTYVEKKPAPRPKNCSIAIPRDRSAKGKSSTR